MHLQECPFPETLELIANDMLCHELGHIEWWKRNGSPFGKGLSWLKGEKDIQEATAQFIEDLKFGRAQPLIVLDGKGKELDSLTLPLPFRSLDKSL